MIGAAWRAFLLPLSEAQLRDSALGVRDKGMHKLWKIITTGLDWKDLIGLVQDWWPLAVPVATAWAGYFQSVPLMWIITATCLATMGAVVAGLAVMFQMERKNPANKLHFTIAVGIDLLPEQIPATGNRSQRRAKTSDGLQVLSPHRLQIDVTRKIDKAQIGVELFNSSPYPMSCYVHSAYTSLDGLEPGRTKYPRPAFLLLGGGKIRMLDDSIDMEGHPAQRMLGHIDMTIMYGHKGRENNTLRIFGNVSVVMEHFGFVSHVLLEHIPPPP